MTKIGTGTLTLSGANTYTGNTNINGGKLNVGSVETAGTSGPLGNQLANAAGTISFGGGTLQYSAANQFDYSGRFSTAASQPISVDTNSQSVIFATALTSSGGTLTKLGAGTLTLTNAANTYTGLTTISAGTLSAANIVVGGGQSNLGNATSAVVLGDTATKGTLSYTGSTATYTRGFTVLAGGGEIDTTTAGQTLTLNSGTITGSKDRKSVV